MQALPLILEPGEMDDAGMWAWAGILTAVVLVVSWFVALGWQRWRESRKDREA